jgi:hypothetical protein
MRSAQQREPGSHPHPEPGWLLALIALAVVMITVGGATL